MSYITSFKTDDGFGGQFHRMLNTILLAELTGNEFVYRPFEKMHHNYDDDPLFIERKEKFINIKPHFKNLSEVNPTEVVELQPRVPEVEANLDICLASPTMSRIKQYFHEGKTYPFEKNILNVAVHIRRENPHDTEGPSYYHEAEYYLSIIEYIRKTYDGEKRFYIYSQGEDSEFSEFLTDDSELHLNESIEDTFYGMVCADILVMSKSSFSYAAAMLSDGVIYHIPFWHAKASHWKIFS